jgi:hypothetical protein
MPEPLNQPASDEPASVSDQPASADAVKSAIQDFLIQEHTTTEADTERLRQEGATRLNILLALFAAVAVATVTVVTSNSLTAAAKATIGYGALASVLIYTLLCYDYFIGREITTDHNFRAASRIRRYYVDLYPHVKCYLTLPSYDDPTHQVTNNHSFVLRAVRHLAAIQIAGGLGVGLVLAGLAHPVCVLVAVASYLLSTLALWGWSACKFDIIVKKTKIRFPNPDPPAKKASHWSACRFHKKGQGDRQETGFPNPDPPTKGVS